ncbi:hypothetical protein [Cupriavidus sp. TMH.W2]|uniref:hypothetical protein n=1 Tax=Cupriavidus sp. TMH.W2 TaxID=3434465 RepID=UPI003D77B612
MEYRCAVFASAAERNETCRSDLEEVPHNVVVDRGLGQSETVRVVAPDEQLAVDLVNAMNDQAYASLSRVEEPERG